MFKQIAEETIKYFRQETLAERSKRMAPGAMYCAIAVIVFGMVSPVINLLFFLDLHLAVDWIGLLTHWIEFGMALAMAGAIVGWFTEEYEGIVWGGVVLAVLILVENLVASLIGGGGAAMVGQSAMMALPLVGAGVLVAGVIRIAINRHLRVKQQENPGIRRRLFVQLTGIVCLIGLILGVFSLFGGSSEYTIRDLNENLQNYATDPLLEWRFPYEKVPALKAHFGMNYTLLARTSTSLTGFMDITIRFEDGYTVTCVVPPPTSNEPMLLDICNEGSQIAIP